MITGSKKILLENEKRGKKGEMKLKYRQNLKKRAIEKKALYWPLSSASMFLLMMECVNVRCTERENDDNRERMTKLNETLLLQIFSSFKHFVLSSNKTLSNHHHRFFFFSFF